MPDGQNGWFVSAPSVVLASAPATVSATIYYSWLSGSGPWSSYAATLSPAEGVRTLWYYAHDNALLRDDETPHSATFSTDRIAPTAPSGSC